MASLVRQQPRHFAVLFTAITILTGVLLAIHPGGLARATSGGNPYSVPLVVDTNPDPDVVETTIVAEEAPVDIGNGVTANALTYNGQIPGPEFRLKVGDTVIVHFENNLEEETGIHWHGIELANASDGTPLVQNQVEPGGKFLYKFIVTRPGIFWYHPHHHASTNQVFKGLYGTIIITDPNEAALQASGVLPSQANTRTLALSDITVCKAPGSNDTATFDPTLPHVSGGALPANPGPTPVSLCETAPKNAEGGDRLDPPTCTVAPCPFAEGDVPNIQRAGTSGPVGEGQTVLTNGMNVGGRAGTPAAPGALAGGAQTLNVLAGQGLRLQMGSEATTRFFRLRLTDNAGVQIPLVRVGGQGGLLDNARVEGGIVAGFDFKYGSGEILIDPGDRADVVVAIPAGASVGDKLTLWTQDFERTGMGFAKTPTVPVAHFNVTGTAGSVYTIADGTPLRAATGDLVETLPAATGTLLDPATFSPAKPGMSSQDIQLTNTGTSLGINGILGEHDFPGVDYTAIDHPDSTRYAKLGDTLELTVTNVTDAHHPFHLHGFSIQPIELTHATLSPYLFPYHEFKDNIDVPARYTLRFRVRLDDRFLMDGTTLGGGLGRWVFHCHIFFHASFGMISEFDVVAANGNEAPHVNSDSTSAEADAGQVATMTGTYFDPDGDAVTLSSSIGSVTDTGGGTWSWSYPTTGAPNESGLVYVTATDSGGLKGQVAFNLTVTGAISLKEDVLAQANALLPGLPASDAKKLGEAIVKLEQSLDPALWIDDNHIVDKDGNRVFDREKDAVKRLTDLIKDSIPDATLEDMIDALVRADRALATVALADAIAASGDPNRIAEAQNELNKAAEATVDGNVAAAIEHYRNAWKKAREAVL
jgi:FtsP/CotA-like multicopper oxidase with cupredoxin domain